MACRSFGQDHNNGTLEYSSSNSIKLHVQHSDPVPCPTVDWQMVTLADMEGGETFDSSMLGQAEEVAEERVADDNVLVFKGFKAAKGVRRTDCSCQCVLMLRFLDALRP